ncbi:MAG TPA: putative porin [Bacteroidales bacterium]|nr:putative porin [Bacteroidales bacterium]
MRLFLAHIALLILPFTLSASDADTTLKKVTRQWTLTSDYTGEIAMPLDTAFSLFQRYRISDRYSDFNAYPGNYGLPLYQINFFDRVWQPDKYLYSNYVPFMYTPANPRFINTQVPFTEMVWTNGGSKPQAEQTFRIRHSQNINRKLNFGFIYDIVYSLGQYDYQKAANKTFLLHSSYNGDNYTAYFTAGINNLLSFENGGVVDAEFLSDNEYSTADVPVNLNDVNKAQSNLKNRHLMLVQRYSPGGKRDTVTGELDRSGPVTFSHIGIYEWNKRRYLDNYPLAEFYDTILINRLVSSDSLSQSIFSNTFRVDLAAGSAGKFSFGAGAGIRSELRHYGQVVPGDSLTRPDTVAKNQSSLVLTGKIFNNIGDKFGWWASGDLWFQGYRAGDFIVNGRIFKEFSTGRGTLTWDATGAVASYTPSYWYTSWGSNNFAWQFDAGREFRLTVGSSLDYPGRHASIRFNYAIVDNFTYMGPNAMPSQYAGGLSVAALTVKKDFVVWKLHWDNTLLLQKSTNNEVLSLPVATGRSALFLDHIFRFKATNGELSMQIGGEVFMHTLYNSMSYMPSTGRYFSRYDTETGNYPFINVFLNLKVKRTRFFIMFDHINSGLMGYDYFLIPDYPLNVRMLRYGLAWTFYD